MPLSELLLIEKIRALARQTSGRRRGTKDALGAIRVGIGDDCAVLAGSETHDLLVTTDLCIQDVHFRLDWHPAESVGHRCLTRGLSDIAAMGGEPTAAFLSLSMPAHLPQKWVDGFFKGFQRLAKRFGVSLAGGDIATSPRGISADIVVLGRVPKGKAILRSGARPGSAAGRFDLCNRNFGLFDGGACWIQARGATLAIRHFHSLLSSTPPQSGPKVARAGRGDCND